jgi:molybdate transport system regulatory protein
MKPKVQFRLRIYRDDSIAIGPGKVALLEAIAETGSISAAARQIGMSYRRAWVLVDETNKALSSPAVQTLAGGSHGGGTALTPVGKNWSSATVPSRTPPGWPPPPTSPR